MEAVRRNCTSSIKYSSKTVSRRSRLELAHVKAIYARLQTSAGHSTTPPHNMLHRYYTLFPAQRQSCSRHVRSAQYIRTHSQKMRCICRKEDLERGCWPQIRIFLTKGALRKPASVFSAGKCSEPTHCVDHYQRSTMKQTKHYAQGVKIQTQHRKRRTINKLPPRALKKSLQVHGRVSLPNTSTVSCVKPSVRTM